MQPQSSISERWRGGGAWNRLTYSRIYHSCNIAEGQAVDCEWDEVERETGDASSGQIIDSSCGS